MSTTYSIGDLAREFDLTTRAIRFYEDLGLLEPLRTGPADRHVLAARHVPHGHAVVVADQHDA